MRIVRADKIEAPVEALRSAGMERSAWEPQFLAVAEHGRAPRARRGARQLRELISVMRLFKEGGVGLGPHAFAPTGEDNWRRIPTGAPPTRPGGYPQRGRGERACRVRRSLEARPDPEGALAWAVAPLRDGLRPGEALEGLSDHLLALRALFEGNGPVGATLPMRAAALIAESPRERRERPDERGPASSSGR